MKDDLNRDLKPYFSGRARPPQALSAALRQKLLAAEQRRKRRSAWLVLGYAAALSALLDLSLWLLLGINAITGALNAFSALALLGGTVITIAATREEPKGGYDHAGY